MWIGESMRAVRLGWGRGNQAWQPGWREKWAGEVACIDSMVDSMIDSMVDDVGRRGGVARDKI